MGSFFVTIHVKVHDLHDLCLVVNWIDLFNGNYPILRGIPYQNPPNLIFFTRVERGVNRTTQSLQLLNILLFSLIICLFNISFDIKMNLSWRSFLTSHFVDVSFKQKLEIRVSVAHWGQFEHLLLWKWHKLLSLIILHVHEISDVDDSSLIFQFFNKPFCKVW